MKKETILLIAAGAAAIYFLSRRSSGRGVVTVTSPEIVTERDFETRTPSAQELSRPIDQIRNIAQTLFKRSPEKKAAAQARRLQKKQTKRKRKVSGFSDNVLC